MSGKHGIAQLKKVVLFGVELGNVLGSMPTGATALGRAAAFLAVVDEAADLLTLDRAELKAEFGELDDADQSDLVAAVAAKLKLPHDAALEAKVEASFHAGLKVIEGIEATVAVWKGAA